MIEKFGNNPPLSGFLDEMESAVIRKYISPSTLKFLDAFCETDEYFTSGRDFVLSRPDMTEEQLERQLDSMDEFEKEFRLGKGWKGSNPNLSSKQMLLQMNAEYDVMKQLREAQERTDKIMEDLGEAFEE